MLRCVGVYEGIMMLACRSRQLLCLPSPACVTTGIAEVMSLVTPLPPHPQVGSQEVTGPTDPIRVMVSHTLQPDSRSISFSVELLSRLSADMKGLVLRYYINTSTASLAGQANQ